MDKSKRPLLISLFACIFLFVNVQSQGDTTSFTYDSFTPQAPTGLTYQGDVDVPLNTTTLRLASILGTLTYNTVGRVVYSDPIQFWDSGREASFETTIRFLITSPDPNPGDGIAFFIAPVNSTIPPGSHGANLGVFGSYGEADSTFAVEFDIYPNVGWDPVYRHIGIDIVSRRSSNVTRFDGILGQEVTARINYESTTRNISVHATVGAQVYSVSYIYDLKKILHQQVQVGISAATGEGAALHDIHSWYFTSTLDSHPPTAAISTYVQ